MAGLNVVSLFNGIGVGHLALQRLGVPLGSYYTSEVCPYANEISKGWNPGVVALGDVTKLGVSSFGGDRIDLLMGGSPCQSFSIAGNGKGFADPRGSLLGHFIRLLRDLKPRYFLLENVVMSAHCQRVVTIMTGVEPVVLDSAWWCAQQRKRCYWTNIPLPTMPEQSDRVLGDVTRGVVTERRMEVIKAGEIKGGGQGNRIYSPNGKGITLSAYSGGTAGPAGMLVGSQGSWRKLRVWEAEQLQMLPISYTKGIPEKHRRRVIGNSWTTGVIQYILSGML